MGSSASKSSYKEVLKISPGLNEVRTLLWNGEEDQYIWKSEGKIPMETPVTVKIRPFDHGIVHTALVARMYRPYAQEIRLVSKPSWVKTDKISKINEHLGKLDENTRWFTTKPASVIAGAFDNTTGRTITIEPLELGLMPFRYEIGEVVCFFTDTMPGLQRIPFVFQS